MRTDGRSSLPYPERREPMPSAVRDDRSLGDLFKELGREMGMLVRQEIQLAKSELGEKAAKAGRNAAFAAAGGLVAFAGFLALVHALAQLLGTFMPDWIGYLIAGLLVAAVGAALLMQGIKGLKETDYSLERTTETLKEDKQWIQEEARQVKEDPAHLGARR